jgi:hypothetical protein
MVDTAASVERAAKVETAGLLRWWGRGCVREIQMVWWTVCFSGNSCKGERSRHSRNGRKNREHGTIAAGVETAALIETSSKEDGGYI